MSARPSSLLDVVRGLLERTYAMRHGIADVGSFVVGDQGFQMLYAERELARSVGASNRLPGAPDGQGARTLVRETGDGVRVAMYLPDAMVRRLECHPPLRGVGDSNVLPFAALVEELDHLLVIAERARQHRPVTLFELELHANVSKSLVLSRFLAGSDPVLSEDKRRWLQHRLFDGVRYSERQEDVRLRYEEAARWAVRFLQGLRPLEAPLRLDALRRFHDASPADKLRLIDGCAA